MSEMVDKVAKALFDLKYDFDRVTTWEDISDADQNVYRAGARAAIQAMREPTEEMIEAADGEYRDDNDFALVGEWQTMIDAALASTPALTSNERKG